MERIEKYKLWLSVAAIVISIVSLFFTFNNNSKIGELSFQNSGIQNRPLLKFQEKVDFYHLKLQLKKPITADDLYNKNSRIEASLIVDPELKITNSGNSVARVLCEAVTDKCSGLPELREKLFDDNDWKSLNVRLTDSYYGNLEVLPGKSYSLRLPQTINDMNVKSNESTIHYMIIYENEAGNVYDSYFWIRFKTYPIQVNYATDGKYYAMQLDKEQKDKFFRVIDTHFSSYMYSLKDSKRILKIRKEYQNKLLKRTKKN